jgi:Protein of unknown function (DUF3292)
MDVSQKEVDAAQHPKDEDETKSKEDPGKEKGKTGKRILRVMKFLAKAGVESALGTDRLKAEMGSRHSKNRLGIIPKSPTPTTGPVDFKARYKGKRGTVYISTSATIPCIGYTTGSDLDPVWTVAIGDIKEIRKIGGLGWKAKLIVGWALNREVADGLAITDREGNTWGLTAMALRDELFNRLVAIGGQKWESC